jgi:hypothetical protein
VAFFQILQDAASAPYFYAHGHTQSQPTHSTDINFAMPTVSPPLHPLYIDSHVACRCIVAWILLARECMQHAARAWLLARHAYYIIFRYLTTKRRTLGE